MKTDYVPVQEVTTAEEARAAMLRAAAIRRRLDAAGRAAQAEFAEAGKRKQQAAIDRVNELTARYEAERRQREAKKWERAINETVRYSARAARFAHKADATAAESEVLQSRRLASKIAVIKRCREIASRYGVSFEMVCGDSRRKHVVVVRHYIIRFVARCRPDWSLTAMGRMFKRDHTSILHALKKRGRPQRLSKREIKEALRK